ncbi:hypothetical protein EA187_09275 [Lujinxingia sediminis]|uniref:BNR repeat domain protein n=1 Tax=Lujinxingia sediminis TaxID=2480984 RepID=A0ABY0CUB3_9DELT|nr:hypothetical protein [Lujinxingia sediminis]RVU44724.1 hypothetical protein EA187_09275 [Lujinxingia sediminis]
MDLRSSLPRRARDLAALLTSLALLTACSDIDSDPTRAAGGLAEACYPNDTCDEPYICSEQGVCVQPLEDIDAGDTDISDTDDAGDAEVPDADDTDTDDTDISDTDDTDISDTDDTDISDTDDTDISDTDDADATCIPLTCADLGAQCGPVDNGCGEPLQCGSCAAYQTNAGLTGCIEGTCEYACRPGSLASAEGCRDHLRVAAGSTHSCALDAQGQAYCWGANAQGQLGDGTTERSLVPVAVQGLEGIVLSAIYAGESHTCGLSDAGQVYCWGANAYGQLGDGTAVDRLVPTALTGLSEPVLSLAIGARGDHTCAITAGGAPRCWGRNDKGQLGDGTTAHRATPTTLLNAPSEGVVAIAAGTAHTCLGHSDTWMTKTFCVGDNAIGQLGDGTQTTRHSLTETSRNVRSFDLGAGGHHTCSLNAYDGRVICWGRNDTRQLGNVSGDVYFNPPTERTIPAGAVRVRAGEAHTCAQMDNGGLTCWGKNTSGQTTDARPSTDTPRDVAGHTFGTLYFDTGANHTCSIQSDQIVRCWGSNGSGQLGNGSTTATATPVEVTLP